MSDEVWYTCCAVCRDVLDRNFLEIICVVVVNPFAKDIEDVVAELDITVGFCFLEPPEDIVLCLRLISGTGMIGKCLSACVVVLKP